MNFNFANTVKIDEPLLCITFDDAFKTDYTFAYPEMKKRGMLGTTYVIGYYTDRFDKYMTSQQLLDLHANGWDLQCHTYDHPYLSTLNASQVNKQMMDTDAKFAELGLPRPLHHAFPYGDYIHETREVISKYRVSQRATGETVSSPQKLEDIDFSRMGAVIGDIQTQQKYDEIKGLLDRAVAEKKVLILYWHEMTDIKKPFFVNFLDYAVSTGIKTVTHAELYDIYKWRKFQYRFL